MMKVNFTFLKVNSHFYIFHIWTKLLLAADVPNQKWCGGEDDDDDDSYHEYEYDGDNYDSDDYDDYNNNVM